MYIFLTIVIVIVAVLLTLLVLVQNSKGGGLAAGFSSSNQVLGVRKTTDFLEKATWGLTAFIVVLAIFAASMHPYRASADEVQSAVPEQYQQATQESGAALPGFGEALEEEAEAAQE